MNVPCIENYFAALGLKLWCLDNRRPDWEGYYKTYADRLGDLYTDPLLRVEYLNNIKGLLRKEELEKLSAETKESLVDELSQLLLVLYLVDLPESTTTGRVFQKLEGRFNEVDPYIRWYQRWSPYRQVTTNQVILLEFLAAAFRYLISFISNAKEIKNKPTKEELKQKGFPLTKATYLKRINTDTYRLLEDIDWESLGYPRRTWNAIVLSRKPTWKNDLKYALRESAKLLY